MAPGSLASIFGTDLADLTTSALFDASVGGFRQTSGGTTVSVNGVLCPLIYVSPGQINFQVPWQTPVGKQVDVQVVRDGIPSNSQPVTFKSTAPSAFGVNAVALVGCVGTSPKVCTLWGNGFGPRSIAATDGVPNALRLAQTASSCKLAFGPLDAAISYCGAAPGLIIGQLNFSYPDGLAGAGSTVAATLTIGEVTGNLVLPLAR